MDAPTRRRRAAPLRTWLAGRPYTALAAVVLVGLSAWFVRRQDSEWEDVFVGAAQALWSGGDVYAPGTPYSYPPFMALASLPFAALPPGAGRWAWLAVNLAALAALLRWSWRLAGGGPLQGGPPAPRREHVAAWLGLACGLSYLQNCLAHHQTDIVLAALVAGGCLLLARSRWFAGATCLGLAAACKCTPLLFAPYLVWRRRRKAALWLVAVAVGVNLLPDLVSRPASGRRGLAEFGARFLRPMAHADHYVGTWASDVVYNQSLAGAGLRWVATTWRWSGDDCVLAPRPGLVHPLVLRGLVYGAGLLLLAGALWACGPGSGHAGDLPDERVPRQAWECAVVVLLMLLLSPMSSKAHFGVLVLPGFCLARATLGSGDRLRWSLLVPAVLLGLLANKDPLGPGLYTLTLWYGSVTWQAVLLLLGCCLVVRQDRPGTAAAPCPGVLMSGRTPERKAA